MGGCVAPAAVGVCRSAVGSLPCLAFPAMAASYATEWEGSGRPSAAYPRAC